MIPSATKAGGVVSWEHLILILSRTGASVELRQNGGAKRPLKPRDVWAIRFFLD